MRLGPPGNSLTLYVHLCDLFTSVRGFLLTRPCFRSTGESEPPSQLLEGGPLISFAIDGPAQSAMRKSILPLVLPVPAMSISGLPPRAL
jgi:hypothetical protein